MTTLHLVSHTHWDREWYQTFQQFRLKLVHLIDNLLVLLDTDPAFKYFMLDGQTIVLDDYLFMRPEQEARLRSYIQSGRIIIGPWHILPDEFLVSPEATIRNLLQGDRTARKYGPIMKVGYIPDPFGHIGQMPQILRGFGIETACVQRGLADEPCEFIWQAPDGTSVFMAYLRDGYGNAAELPTSESERFISEICRLRDHLIPFSATGAKNGHLLLMFGTDHMEVPSDTSQAIDLTNQHLDGDILLHSTLPEYIAAIQSALREQGITIPTVSGELRSSKRYHLLPNVLSARMWIKQRNHTCQTLLEKWAEPFSTWASLLDSDYDSGSRYRKTGRIGNPAPLLRQTWRLLMENHPHDSICGCSIDQVHEEMRSRFDQVSQITEEIISQSLAAIAVKIDTSADHPGRKETGDSGNEADSAIVVFNPTGMPCTGVVPISVELIPGSNGINIVDELGNPLPHQELGMGNHELINARMAPETLRASISMVHEGRVAGMVIHDIAIQHEGSQCLINATLADNGEPNLAVWERSVRQIMALVDEPGIETFVVHASSVPSSSAIFVARDIPPYGYQTFWAHSVQKPHIGSQEPIRVSPIFRLLLPLAGYALRLVNVGKLGSGAFRSTSTGIRGSTLTKKSYTIENEFFSIKASPGDGTLTLVDKRTGVSYPGLNRFVDGGDCGDEYTYSPPSRDTLVSASKINYIQIQRGEVFETIDISLLLRVPVELAADRQSRSTQLVDLPIKTRATLIRDVPRLDIHTEADNGQGESARVRDHRLRVHFPTPIHTFEVEYDGHFEIVRRPIALPPFDSSWAEQPRPEKPQRGFTNLFDGKIGLMIANRGLPEVEVFNNPADQAEIALTLLRCVGWLSRDDFSTRRGHAGPAIATPGAQMPGIHHFDYSLIPHNLGMVNQKGSLLYHQAEAFITPMRGISTTLHAGNLATNNSLIQVNQDSFVVSAIKTAEAGNGWIVRGFNLTGQPILVTIKPWMRFNRAAIVNLAEETKSELNPQSDGSVSFTANGYEIVTLKFSQ